MEIFFKSAVHRERFLEAIQQIEKVYDGKLDPEYGSALYILTSSLSMWQKAHSYVKRRGIAIEDMLHEEDFSGGQSVLVLLAGNLFNNGQHIDPLELTRLDSDNFHVALAALTLRCHSVHIDETRSKAERDEMARQHQHAENERLLNLPSVRTEN